VQSDAKIGAKSGVYARGPVETVVLVDVALGLTGLLLSVAGCVATQPPRPAVIASAPKVIFQVAMSVHRQLGAAPRRVTARRLAREW
jgi:hypothetical protein